MVNFVDYQKETDMPVIKRPTEPTHRLEGTSFTSLATPTTGSTDTSVWQVQIAAGTPAVPHRLTREEVFVVLQGTAAVRIGAERTDATVGDAIVVPVGVPFELANGGDEELRLLCCMPTDGQARLEDGDGDAFTPPWAL
jgi:mannose-6-phosphate isomerase-like protein (cupin superfamily)